MFYQTLVFVFLAIVTMFIINRFKLKQKTENLQVKSSNSDVVGTKSDLDSNFESKSCPIVPENNTTQVIESTITIENTSNIPSGPLNETISETKKIESKPIIVTQTPKTSTGPSYVIKKISRKGPEYPKENPQVDLDSFLLQETEKYLEELAMKKKNSNSGNSFKQPLKMINENSTKKQAFGYNVNKILSSEVEKITTKKALNPLAASFSPFE
ncbi:hypothetical protein SteCoe_15378 [Stentor coeruleus]|uniref:Uncharacterized protein n=1 Tax=Stentor coeruleus TaxID=5963 RepID=A0A1R2C3U3_9CILI|nr:hypothetical protein SteCoe_15378 [Stentor coeruleus]